MKQYLDIKKSLEVVTYILLLFLVLYLIYSLLARYESFVDEENTTDTPELPMVAPGLKDTTPTTTNFTNNKSSTTPSSTSSSPSTTQSLKQTLPLSIQNKQINKTTIPEITKSESSLNSDPKDISSKITTTTSPITTSPITTSPITFNTSKAEEQKIIQSYVKPIDTDLSSDSLTCKDKADVKGVCMNWDACCGAYAKPDDCTCNSPIIKYCKSDYDKCMNDPEAKKIFKGDELKKNCSSRMQECCNNFSDTANSKDKFDMKVNKYQTSNKICSSLMYSNIDERCSNLCLNDPDCKGFLIDGVNCALFSEVDMTETNDIFKKKNYIGNNPARYYIKK